MKTTCIAGCCMMYLGAGSFLFVPVCRVGAMKVIQLRSLESRKSSCDHSSPLHTHARTHAGADVCAFSRQTSACKRRPHSSCQTGIHRAHAIDLGASNCCTTFGRRPCKGHAGSGRAGRWHTPRTRAAPGEPVPAAAAPCSRTAPAPGRAHRRRRRRRTAAAPSPPPRC